MAAFSVKSITGPFRNKVHLVSLVLITALFGAYRWSGGGFSVHSTDARPDPSQAAVPVNVPVRQNPLVANDRRPVQQQQQRPATNRPRTTTKRALSLEEIESELGLGKKQ